MNSFIVPDLLYVNYSLTHKKEVGKDKNNIF